MADGHLNKCAVCTRRDVQTNYASRREHYQAYDRARYSPERVARMIELRDPKKHRARFTLHNAVNRGKLQKQPCEVCGAKKVEAHHVDYSRPLDVRWLCKIHHGKVHRMEKS